MARRTILQRQRSSETARRSASISAEQRAIKPPGVTAHVDSAEWWDQNKRSFEAWIVANRDLLAAEMRRSG